MTFVDLLTYVILRLLHKDCISMSSLVGVPDLDVNFIKRFKR